MSEIHPSPVLDQGVLSRLALAIARNLSTSPEGIASNNLRTRVCSSATRHYYDPALDLAVEKQWVRIEYVTTHGSAGRRVFPSELTTKYFS